jgi:zinc transport system substrate-binding protein
MTGRVPILAAAIGLIGLALALACGTGEAEKPPGAEAELRDERLLVFAVAYPLQYFAERIGGDAVDVRFPIPAGIDPAKWSPSAEVVAEYQAADLVLLNGGGYAQWLKRASLPRRRLVDTSAGFPERRLRESGGVEHAHGPEGEHAHAGVASMTWIDPELAIAQARAITDALLAVRPSAAERFESGFAALERDLRALEHRFAAAAQQLGGAPLFFSHPVYPYFIRRYGLNARSLHWEPHEVPTEVMWTEFRAALVEHPARWMLWEAPPEAASEALLEGLGVRSRVFDPCAQPSESGDYLERMRRNVEEFETLGVNHPAVSGVQ